MPLPREDVDATTPKFLRDKYAVVGVGETAYTRGSNITTRALATIAVRNAMLDAGLKASEIDGMLSYQLNDSVFSPFVAGDREVGCRQVKNAEAANLGWAMPGTGSAMVMLMRRG